MPSNPDTKTPSTAAIVSTHRWPWRTEEFISMAVSVGFVLALGYWISTMRPFYAIPILAGAVLIALGSVFALYRTKIRRVTKSQVTITIIGTHIRSESDGPLGRSQVDVARTKSIGYRRFGSDETFMITDGLQTARIPVRTARDENVRALLATAVEQAAEISDEASDLYARLPRN